MKKKPSVVFSKGGFVSVPVVVAAWLNKVPVIIHESDLTPGLANKIASKFSALICTTFPETVNAFSNDNCHYVGSVIRDEIINGNAERGHKFVGFSQTYKPTMLVMGGV